VVGLVFTPGKVAVPEDLNGRFPIERGAVESKLGEQPRQWRWRKINSLQLDPRDAELFRTAVHFAKKFRADMEKQGFLPYTDEADMLIHGPLKHRRNDTGGNAVGHRVGDTEEDRYADFYIRGRFIRTRALAFEHRD
jgi:hypothetical protein